MRTLAGWRLAKAYDMNPSVKKPEHVLGIDEGQHGPSLETLLETVIYYNLDEFQGLEIIENVLRVVATWRTRAKAMHISMADVEEMDHLFITELA
jgi:serine/threonine-protein kinase HipA